MPWQEFCKGKCRTEYNRLRGVAGRIVVNRRLMKGRTSIVLRFEGPAAESAINLAIGDVVYIAKVDRS